MDASLDYFLGYFHQDWAIDHTDPWEVARFFKTNEPRETVAAVRRALIELAGKNNTDPDAFSSTRVHLRPLLYAASMQAFVEKLIEVLADD